MNQHFVAAARRAVKDRTLLRPWEADCQYAWVFWATFVFLTFFDGQRFRGLDHWATIFTNGFCAALWPFYWLFLRTAAPIEYDPSMFGITLALWLIGSSVAQLPQGADQRFLLKLAGLIAIVVAMQRGLYWDIFPRGHGFFTTNRMSALLAFAFALWGPGILLRLRDHITGTP